MRPGLLLELLDRMRRYTICESALASAPERLIRLDMTRVVGRSALCIIDRDSNRRLSAAA
jgi:hypothetical protein